MHDKIKLNYFAFELFLSLPFIPPLHFLASLLSLHIFISFNIIYNIYSIFFKYYTIFILSIYFIILLF